MFALQLFRRGLLGKLGKTLQPGQDETKTQMNDTITLHVPKEIPVSRTSYTSKIKFFHWLSLASLSSCLSSLLRLLHWYILKQLVSNLQSR